MILGSLFCLVSCYVIAVLAAATIPEVLLLSKKLREAETLRQSAMYPTELVNAIISKTDNDDELVDMLFELLSTEKSFLQQSEGWKALFKLREGRILSSLTVTLNYPETDTESKELLKWTIARLNTQPPIHYQIFLAILLLEDYPKIKKHLGDKLAGIQAQLEAQAVSLDLDLTTWNRANIKESIIIKEDEYDESLQPRIYGRVQLNE